MVIAFPGECSICTWDKCVFSCNMECSIYVRSSWLVLFFKPFLPAVSWYSVHYFMEHWSLHFIVTFLILLMYSTVTIDTLRQGYTLLPSLISNLWAQVSLPSIWHYRYMPPYLASLLILEIVFIPFCHLFSLSYAFFVPFFSHYCGTYLFFVVNHFDSLSFPFVYILKYFLCGCHEDYY